MSADPSAWVPRPIATGNARLSPRLAGLVDVLAENVHDNWAAQRIEDGWRFGPQRDDAAMTHPCLVPYAELPEAEKAYDRRIVAQTLNALVELGFRIEDAPI